MSISKLQEAPVIEPIKPEGSDQLKDASNKSAGIESPKWRQWYAQLSTKFNDIVDSINSIASIILDSPSDGNKVLSGSSPATWILPTLYYGEMAYHNDVSPYTQSITINVVAKVNCFDTATNSQELNGFTYGTSSLTCTKEGMYYASYNISLSCSSSNEKLHTYLTVNNSPKLTTEQHGRVQNASDILPMGASCIMPLSANDIISLAILDESGSATITFYAVTVSLVRIGNT